MHDVGKIAIPDAILNKPGKLTPEEYEVMRRTPRRARCCLSASRNCARPASTPTPPTSRRHHHERWDGRGYPDGLRGDEISPWRRRCRWPTSTTPYINKRVYKAAFPRERALEMIQNGDCGVFGPHLLKCFFAVEERLFALYQR